MQNTKRQVRQDAKNAKKTESEFAFPWRSWRLGVLGVCICCLLGATTTTTRTAKIKIVLAGDSTVTDTVGWGPGFEKSLADDVECINLSRGGRSSRTFIEEGIWKQCLDLKPDYILIQFGHNDQPPKKSSTDLATGYPKFMTQYVDDARAIGAMPILVTSMSRRQWGDDGKIHSNLVPWVDAVKKIAEEKKVPLIDLHALTVVLYEKRGKTWCEAEISPRKDDGTIDGSHLNAPGGLLVGGIVANEVKHVMPALATHIKSPILTVDAEGGGDFKTIQDAVTSVSVHELRPITIHIKPGTYKEIVRVPNNMPHLTFEGEDAATTIITNNISAGMPAPEGGKLGTFRTATVYIDADDFAAENITFENTAGNVGQALALSISGDRVQFKNCKLKGWQDTLYVARGRQYFRDCYIDGHTDFIFGAATTVFDHCKIHCTQASYITAPSTPQDQPFGFVFLKCKLTGGDKTFLGRPWRDYGATAFIECEMGDFIRPQGWDNWRNPGKEKTARFSEYKSTGPGGDPSQRVQWSKQLTDEEASKYTLENIFAGSQPWKPN